MLVHVHDALHIHNSLILLLYVLQHLMHDQLESQSHLVVCQQHYYLIRMISRNQSDSNRCDNQELHNNIIDNPIAVTTASVPNTNVPNSPNAILDITFNT